MNRVLMDTHAFLWLVFDDPRLVGRAAVVMEDPEVLKVLSIASVWEIVIKSQIGKLSLGMDTGTFCRNFVTGLELELLPIELPHLITYSNLDLHHRDPFDRLLISQAIVGHLPIVTRDAAFKPYAIETIWS